MSDLETQQALIDDLAEEFARRCREGDSPTVEEFTARHPELADKLAEILPSVALLEQMKPNRSAPAGMVGLSAGERLGDYRILREVGRGGMGIVYEAIQESLGRRVALKLLPSHSLLRAKSLERFRLEAQAAARLHHTNIVPVFGFFETDGLHYYAMQFIDGRGLDTMLSELRTSHAHHETPAAWMSTLDTNWPAAAETPPVTSRKSSAVKPTQKPALAKQSTGTPSYWRQVATIGAQAADALNYAHQQGTLHRDVKPANLLLDKHGNVWVTDFGLAKLMESDGLTAAGDVLGTLPYMAPETFHGQFGPQSDVYSLGLTLYELLTLEPGFQGSNPASLMRTITEQDPPRPRSRNPAIPRDLETIVLKATAREARDRYASGGALADDLRRFLEDRPITARRSSALERTWRWCRRNKALAASAGAALASLCVAAVIGWWAYAVTTRSLASEAERRVEAEAATSRAEANMNLSLRALEEIFAALAPPQADPWRPPRGRRGPPGHGDGPPGGPGHRPDGPDHPPPMFGVGEKHPPGFDDFGDKPSPESTEDTKRRAELMHAVLSFYEQFSAQNQTDPKLRSNAAGALRRVAEIHRRLGEAEQARSAYHRSAAMFEELVAQFPGEPNYAEELIGTRLEEASLAAEATDWPTAGKILLAAVPIAKKLNDADPQPRNFELLSTIYGRLGRALEEQGQVADAKSYYQLALASTERVQADRRQPEDLEQLADQYQLLIGLCLSNGQKSDAMALVDELEQRLDHAPGTRRHDEVIFKQYDDLADLVEDANRAKELRQKADRMRHRFEDGPRGDSGGGPGGGPSGGHSRPRPGGKRPPPHDGPPTPREDASPPPPPPRR
jgi:serine/threonine protein kinase